MGGPEEVLPWVQYPVSVSPVLTVPDPVSATICGLPVALSAIETVPFSSLVLLGVKVTVIMQFAPGARVEPQVLVCAKSAVAAARLTPVSDAVP
jgi:hypothetical protein